jgi:hypothetical protein
MDIRKYIKIEWKEQPPGQVRPNLMAAVGAAPILAVNIVF